MPDRAQDAPYFFLSHARSHWAGGDNSPKADPWVEQLFEDLCQRVSSLLAAPSGAAVGFMGRELLTGADWPPGLRRALATCRIFVPLYSRRYFETDQCGREWSAFTLRLRGRDASAPSAIVPALWTPVDQGSLPEAARSIPWDDAGMRAYGELGFYGLIKVSRYRADYEKAVKRLASGIVDAGSGTLVADGPALDYSALENAFGAAGQQMRGGQPLRVTIVAPSVGDLPPGRGRYYYGTAARDWDPYRPKASRVLADHVSDIARRLGYQPFVGDLPGHAAELLSGRRPSAPGVLFVDPWATRQDDRRQLLMRLDAMDNPWIQVLVPWNKRDAESTAAEAELRDALDGALRRKLAEGNATSALAVRGVPTLEDLGQVLPAVIVKAVRQYQRQLRLST